MDLYDALSIQTKEELVESLFDRALNNDTQIIGPRDYVTHAHIPLLHVDLVEALIDNGLLDVNSRYYDMNKRLLPEDRGCILLCYAVMWGNIPLIEMLVRKNANVNLGAIDGFGHTPLSCAVDFEVYNHHWDHRIHMIEMLHSAGNLSFDIYVPNSPGAKHILLHVLTHWGVNMLDQLLALGADINTQFSPKNSGVGDMNLFTFAVLFNNHDIARQLKRRGANSDHVFIYYDFGQGGIKRYTALQYIVADPMGNGTENQLNRLLDIGVGLNVTDHKGCTPLWNLARANKIQMCVRLIEQGADVSIRCQERHGNSTALGVARPDCRAAMKQALLARRILHVRAIRARFRLPKEMIEKVILENGL